MKIVDKLKLAFAVFCMLSLLSAVIAAIIGVPLMVVSLTLCMIYGGTAVNGFSEAGHWFVSGGGISTEVSERVYNLMWTLEMTGLVAVCYAFATLFLVTGLVWLVVKLDERIKSRRV